MCHKHGLRVWQSPVDYFIFLCNDCPDDQYLNCSNYNPAFKILNGQTPIYMCNLISVSHNTSYNLRSSTNHKLAILKRPKTNYLQNTFGYSSRMVWNGIPLNIKNNHQILMHSRPILNYFDKILNN